MKRGCAALLAFCLLVTCGCSATSQKTFMYVVDGAYNLTPQEFIARVNQHVEAQNDSTYKTIPEFEQSGEKIEISRGAHMRIETNDAGKITKVEYSWMRYSDSIKITALLMGTTIGLLTSEEEGDAVIAELDMMNPDRDGYETVCGANGSRFWYSSVENSKFNFLTIEPDATQ